MTETSSPIALHRALERIWGSGRGWQRLAAVNHNVLGKRFMLTAFVFFAIGGALSMVIRAQLATPQSAFLGPEIYNQVFTMHGTVMMFLFAIPMFEGLAIYFLPKLLGTRDMAYPRLTAYGFWCYLFGGSILVAALAFGAAPASGWFMYTPLSSKPYSPGINADVWLLGVTFVEISAMLAAVEFIVSILKLRAPGMSLARMPIFGWYILVTAGMMLFGFPPLILGSILLELERAFDLPFFDPVRGGDSLLWQHLFWLFGHPEVYIIFLPAAGVLSTLIPVFAQRPLLGYRLVVVALIAMGFLSFGLWVHHMFTVGIPHLALGFFSAASGLVAIPTAIQIFTWIGTLAHGRPRFELPMLYVVGFFVVFVMGGLTGVMLAMVPFDSQAHDSHFVVAHLHYVLVGGFVFPMLAALYYWLPHVTGRLPVYRLAVPAFWLILVGFNLTFFLMHLTGLLGMPRRVYTYPEGAGWDWLNLLSSIGGFITSAGLALILMDVVLQFRFGPRFRRNPWRAGTLDWAMATPAPSYNFASLPEISARADDLEVDRLAGELAGGKGYLGFVRSERLEVLGVDPVSGAPTQLVVLPRPSLLPLITALLTGAVVLSLLFKLYLLGGICFLATIAAFLMWPTQLGHRSDQGELPIGRGQKAPLEDETRGSLAWWGVLIWLGADATLGGSLVFGALFLVVVAPGWPPAEILEHAWALSAIPAGLFVAAAAARRWAAKKFAQRRLALAAAALLHAGTTGGLLVVMLALPDPRAHAYAAISFALLGYGLVHAGLGTLLSLHALWRDRQGYVSPRRANDLRIGVLWNDFAAASGLVMLGVVALLPELAGIGRG
jgi:cytochrome c oxidase subunit I+III